MTSHRKLDHRKLWAIEDALRDTVAVAFRDAHGSDLKLRGPLPEAWPADERGQITKGFIDLVQKGIVFYCMEDLLWPLGRDKPANRDIFWGSFGRFHRCGEDGTPKLSDFLRTRRHPGRQPVALRTYSDALTYRRTGEIAGNVFPLVNERWAVRGMDGSSVAEIVPQRIRLSILYLFGEPPSKVAESRAPEIHYVVGTKIAGKPERDLFAPPTRAYEHAFRRQVDKLWDEWHASSNLKPDHLTCDWVRDRLGVWDGDDPVNRGGWVGDAVVDAYKQELMERLAAPAMQTESRPTPQTRPTTRQ